MRRNALRLLRPMRLRVAQTFRDRVYTNQWVDVYKVAIPQLGYQVWIFSVNL